MTFMAMKTSVSVESSNMWKLSQLWAKLCSNF